MNAKFIVPYVILGTGLMFVSGQTRGQQEIPPTTPQTKNIILPQMPVSRAELNLPKLALGNFTPEYESHYYMMLDEMNLDKKAENLRDKYMENMLTAQQKLGPLVGKNGYRAAVRRELPGAPVGLHCVYGQYTQLTRALSEMGDTLTIVPRDASRACGQFKYQMRTKYRGPEYDECIREGKMFESDSAYNVALNKYLTRRRIAPNAPDSVRAAAMSDFARKNFSADALDAGTMMIVPRYRGSKNQFHMIMFLGRGRIVNNEFVADSMGKHVYTGHNREKMGYLFDTWDTSNVFAADTKKIARAQYAKEWQTIESKSREELIEFLCETDDANRYHLMHLTREDLLKLARAKYFKQPTPELNTIKERVIAQYSPVHNMIVNQMQRTI